MTPGYQDTLNYYLNNQKLPALQMPDATNVACVQDTVPASVWQDNSYLPYTGDSIYSALPSSSSSSQTGNTDSDKELTYEECLKQFKAKAKEKIRTKALELDEKIQARTTILKQKAKESVNEHGGIGGAMAGAALFATPAIYKAATTDSEILKLFLKENASLYETYPDLMIEAQEALRKYQRNYASDIKRAGKNRKLVEKLKKEQKAMYRNMKYAIRNGKVDQVDDIARLTAECNTASGVRNGFLARTWRGWRGKEKLLSRSKHVADQSAAGAIKYQTPKAGSSFWKNMGGKSAGFGSLLFIGMSFFADKDKIKEAYSLDTSTGNKQLLQTGAKGLASAAFWTLGEAAGKTIAKKCLGKIAARAATTIATKGIGKILGSAIGSFIPGFGTVAGLLLGTAADFLISKFVIPYFMPNDAVDVESVNRKTDDELLGDLSDIYKRGGDIGESYKLLEAKLDEKNLKNLKTLHDMPEEERAAFLAQAESQTHPA